MRRISKNNPSPWPTSHHFTPQWQRLGCRRRLSFLIAPVFTSSASASPLCTAHTSPPPTLHSLRSRRDDVIFRNRLFQYPTPHKYVNDAIGMRAEASGLALMCNTATKCHRWQRWLIRQASLSRGGGCSSPNNLFCLLKETTTINV